jgi:hypothetical protein
MSVFCQLSFINAVRVCAYRFTRAKNPAKIRDSTPDVENYKALSIGLAFADASRKSSSVCAAQYITVWIKVFCPRGDRSTRASIPLPF